MTYSIGAACTEQKSVTCNGRRKMDCTHNMKPARNADSDFDRLYFTCFSAKVCAKQGSEALSRYQRLRE